MKREKEVPAELLAFLEQKKKREENKIFNELNMLYTVPVRMVKMQMLAELDGRDTFRMTIIPAVDVYITDRSYIKKGHFKRDALSYFVSGTRKVFPYGHIYAESGYVCLGSIFVPSAIPERSATMPLETLFLHNDRNLGHGNSHLMIGAIQAHAIKAIMRENAIELSGLSRIVIDRPGADIIKNDEIWSLAADVTEQKSLPDAIRIMSDVYRVIFKKEEVKEKND